MPTQHNWKRRLALLVLPPFGALLIRLLGSTLRYQEIGAAGAHADENPATRVYCMWHRSLLSVASLFRKRKIAILISPSFDGELIAQTIRYIGYTPVRGSSSHGGATGLLGMQRALESGSCNYAALTADGPRGPVYVAKPGGAKLAEIVGGGVGIFYAAPLHAWKLRSWDGFLIPKPFTKIIFRWEPPVSVSLPLDDAGFEAVRRQVEISLERARHAVEQWIAEAGHPRAVQ